MSSVIKLPTWRSQLRMRNGRIIGDEANLALFIRNTPELAILLKHNAFTGKVVFGNRCPWRSVLIGHPWTDADDVALTMYLQEREVDLRGQSTISAVVQVVAADNTFHPVRDYLETEVKWDGTPRLHNWLRHYMEAEGPPEYLAAVGTKFLISAVARVMQPGCQADHVMVWESKQGEGKSSAVRILGGEWTTDSLPDLHSTDAALQLAGVWIVELAELAALRRTSEIESTKAFITRRADRYRPPYGRITRDVPRQCVFIASTNESQYLRDPTGNRRFWPVRCGKVDLEALERDRDQLWAEALHLYEAGETWHLTGTDAELAAQQQAERELVTELEAAVGGYLDKLEAAGLDEVTMRDVLQNALGLDPTDQASFVEKAVRAGGKVAAALNRCGWHRVKATGRGKTREVVYRRAS